LLNGRINQRPSLPSRSVDRRELGRLCGDEKPRVLVSGGKRRRGPRRHPGSWEAMFTTVKVKRRGGPDVAFGWVLEAGRNLKKILK
jgi:hypothetical protein